MSEITTTQPRRGRSALLAIGLVAGFVTVLTACPPPPTPTTTTTTTTSSTTTTIAPGCVGYTPTGIGVSDNLVSVGDSITVSGFGQTSPTIGVEIKMTPIGAGTATGAAPGGAAGSRRRRRGGAARGPAAAPQHRLRGQRFCHARRL